MIGQLIALLIVPLVVGMSLRRWRESFFRRIQPRLQRIGLVAVIALIAWILIARAADFRVEFLPGFLTASLFLIPAMFLGEIVACYKRARERGGDIKLVVIPDGIIHELLQMTCLDGVFQIFGDESEAAAQFNAGPD